MGKTLLLADDSVTIQKVVGISFASEDIAITTVDNGDDAIQRAREMKPDVILADVVMPGKSGYEVCETVKSDPELRHIPVLLLTGTFEAFDEDRAARAGASGHVAKPFEAQTLVDRVKELLAQPVTQASFETPVPAAEPEPIAEAVSAAPPAGADNAFDFFDEPESTPAATPAMDAPAADPARDLDLDAPGGAFAFDEDEFGAATDVVPNPAAAGPPEPAAHTVAILPDTPADDATVFADDALPPLTPPASSTASTETAASTEVAPPPIPANPASPSGGEGFDFEFESMPPVPEPAADAAGTAEPGIAESMLLDPAGDSAFDVSSSQLGDLEVTPEPSIDPEPVAATQLLATEPASELPPPPPAAPTEIVTPPLEEPIAAEPLTAEPDPVMDMLSADPVDSGSSEPAGAFVEEVPTAAPARPEDPMEFAAPEAITHPDAEIPAPVEDEAPLSLSPEPELAPEPEPELAPPPVPEPEPAAAPVPDEALAQIAPALQEQLHETLEKIAWEAFGQVTETVVAQAVERLEKVAWEVVPKLAETLIAEEIRKLKE